MNAAVILERNNTIQNMTLGEIYQKLRQRCENKPRGKDIESRLEQRYMERDAALANILHSIMLVVEEGDEGPLFDRYIVVNQEIETLQRIMDQIGVLEQCE